MTYPGSLAKREDFTLVAPKLAEDALEVLFRAVEADLHHPNLAALLQSIPERDATYAQTVVAADLEVFRSVPATLRSHPSFGPSFLVNKLLMHCEQAGRVPIVGQEYARRILVAKASAPATEEHLMGPAKALTPMQSMSYAAFSAGLSFGFLSDETLTQAPIEKLIEFKRHNRGLLKRHQQELAGLSQFGDSAGEERLAGMDNPIDPA